MNVMLNLIILVMIVWCGFVFLEFVFWLLIFLFVVVLLVNYGMVVVWWVCFEVNVCEVVDCDIIFRIGCNEF